MRTGRQIKIPRVDSLSPKTTPRKAPNKPTYIKRRTKKHKKKGLGLAFVCILLFSIAAGIILCHTVFFKIKNIEIIGELPYPEEDIISLIDIEIGDNLFLADLKTACQNINSSLPLVENDVKAYKKPPSKIVFELKRADNEFAVEFNSKYYICSPKNKIISISNDKPADLPIVTGPDLNNVNICSEVFTNNPEIRTVYQELIKASKAHNLILTEINLANLLDIRVKYDNRFLIKLGTISELDKKINLAKIMIADEEELHGTEITGTVNATLSGNRATISIDQKTD